MILIPSVGLFRRVPGGGGGGGGGSDTVPTGFTLGDAYGDFLASTSQTTIGGIDTACSWKLTWTGTGIGHVVIAGVDTVITSGSTFIVSNAQTFSISFGNHTGGTVKSGTYSLTDEMNGSAVLSSGNYAVSFSLF